MVLDIESCALLLRSSVANLETDRSHRLYMRWLRPAPHGLLATWLRSNAIKNIIGRGEAAGLQPVRGTRARI
jgi:hypothetical protein